MANKPITTIGDGQMPPAKLVHPDPDHLNDAALTRFASATGYLGYHDPGAMHIDLVAFQPNDIAIPAPSTLIYVLTGDQMQDLYDAGIADGGAWS